MEAAGLPFSADGHRGRGLRTEEDLERSLAAFRDQGQSSLRKGPDTTFNRATLGVQIQVRRAISRGKEPPKAEGRSAPLAPLANLTISEGGKVDLKWDDKLR